uniref:Putative ixodes 8-cys protein n=1 Tax=Ixodes ricinus TaxID=34613 RepID=A0A0K8RBM1_IXORI
MQVTVNPAQVLVGQGAPHEDQSSGGNSLDSSPPAHPQSGEQAEQAVENSSPDGVPSSAISQNKEKDENSSKDENPEGSEPKDGTSDGSSGNDKQNDKAVLRKVVKFVTNRLRFATFCG